MSIKVSVYSKNLGDGSHSVVFRRGVWDQDKLVEEEQERGYDGWETYGHVEDVDVIEFIDEVQLFDTLGSIRVLPEETDN